eukprot:TRINITY_DN5111_c0_g1_i1.p1 TRINITY_DN5111_c0_g1~~TRINITY_DN5111_c0_g1_i1.p1  ORF type:complete len:159 (-),score=35.96 TRINITY_DN5111_c0_g1_i1:399-875(-)
MNRFSDWDLKRLETYNKNLIDFNLIKDMIPIFCHLFFNNKFESKLQLNYSQCAVLLGLGFQKKSIEQISMELNIIKQQTISMLNKSVRKIYTFIDKLIKDHIEETEILPEFNKNSHKNRRQILNRPNNYSFEYQWNKLERGIDKGVRNNKKKERKKKN